MAKTILFFLLLTIHLVSPTNAGEDHHHHDEDYEFEEHSSHVHGHATANASLEDNILSMALTFSSIDIFGFEHAPKNSEQRKKIEQTLTMLENADNLFLFNTTNVCEINSVSINSEIIKSDTDNHHEDEHHDEHGHNDTHNEEIHSDVAANYEFTCSEDELESIEYLIFDNFPSLEKIEVQFISSEHQTLFEATNEHRVQSLK